jgi:hypothetical protein
MGPLDALLHLANFFAPALGVAMFTTTMAKLIWRRDLAAVAWWRLFAWSSVAGAIALIGGLVFFGRDGKMATYLALAVAAALALWGTGFATRR